MAKIYALVDPYTEKIKYIGYTTGTLKRRLQLHLSHANKNKTYVQRWIKSLSTSPLIIEIDDVEDYIFWEIHYISLFKSWGFKLCNLTTGGEGIPNLKHSEETKKKISERNLRLGIRPPSNLGNKHSEETKKVMSNKAKGRVITKEQKEKMSLAKLGKYISGNSILSKKVIQINKEGSEIKVWNSVSEACRELKTSRSNIARAIRNDGYCVNYKWKYLIN